MRFTSSPAKGKLLLLNPFPIEHRPDKDRNPGTRCVRALRESGEPMEFLRKLFKSGSKAQKPESDQARGGAPVQSQEEQDATRARMEAEMADQKERRESSHRDQ